jgi:hypothetical protein
MEVREPDRFYETLGELALAENLPISGVSSPDNNLESVFRYLVEA